MSSDRSELKCEILAWSLGSGTILTFLLDPCSIIWPALQRAPPPLPEEGRMAMDMLLLVLGCWFDWPRD